MPLWIGGLLETGVGRAANLAFASLPGVTLPCDISATDRYYDPDLTEPPFVLADKSRLIVPDAAGLGVMVQPDRLAFDAQAWRDAIEECGLRKQCKSTKCRVQCKYKRKY